MDLNSLVVDIIKSDYIKDCITKDNYVFTYEEQLAIILNSDKEISKKLSMLKMYLESKDAIEALGKLYINDITNIIVEMEKVLNYINGSIDNIVLTYKTDTNLVCARKLDKLLDKIGVDTIDDCIEVDINNIDEVEEIGYIVVSSEGTVIGYCLTHGVDSELYSQFVSVPNDLHIGDVVSHVGNEDKYIIVSNPILPSKFKSGLTYRDISVVVIPIELLDPEKDYKKQIEEIYTDRINNIENPCAKPDIIMEYYDTVNILNIQK